MIVEVSSSARRSTFGVNDALPVELDGSDMSRLINMRLRKDGAAQAKPSAATLCVLRAQSKSQPKDTKHPTAHRWSLHKIVSYFTDEVYNDVLKDIAASDRANSLLQIEKQWTQQAFLDAATDRWQNTHVGTTEQQRLAGQVRAIQNVENTLLAKKKQAQPSDSTNPSADETECTESSTAIEDESIVGIQGFLAEHNTPLLITCSQTPEIPSAEAAYEKAVNAGNPVYWTESMYSARTQDDSSDQTGAAEHHSATAASYRTDDIAPVLRARERDIKDLIRRYFNKKEVSC